MRQPNYHFLGAYYGHTHARHFTTKTSLTSQHSPQAGFLTQVPHFIDEETEVLDGLSGLFKVTAQRNQHSKPQHLP